jgi:hypothetical protein
MTQAATQIWNSAGQHDTKTFFTPVIPSVPPSGSRRIFARRQLNSRLTYRSYSSKQSFVNGRAELDHFAVDMVIVKPDARLATELKTSPGWEMLFDEGKAAVLQAKLSTMQKLDRRTDRRS